MKPFLFLLFPLLGLLPLHAEELPQMIQLNPDGTFRIEDAEFRLQGATENWSLFDNRNLSGKKGECSRNGIKLTGALQVGGETAVLTETVEPTGKNTFRVQFRAEFSNGVKLNSLHGVFQLPRRKLAVYVDGKLVMLPVKNKTVPIAKANAKTFSFTTANGFRVTVSGKPLNLLLQDNSKFGNDTYSVRFKATPDTGIITTSRLMLDLKVEPVATGKVDLARFANAGFRDEIAGDGKGGWTDQGPENDLRMLPPGTLRFGALEFNILDETKNSGRGAIVVSGRNRKFTEPEISLALPENNAGAVNLLHASAWTPKRGETLGVLTAEYADGSSEKIPVISRKHCGNWHNPGDEDGRVVAWSAELPETAVGLYITSFPLKKRAPKSLRFKIVPQNAVWMIAGVTLSAQPIHLVSADSKPLEIRENAQWKRLNYKRTLTKGSPLDFSRLLDAPAGKYGFIRPAADGTLTFENAPDKRIRLYGINLCGSANYLSRKEVDGLADYLAFCGYNSVRIHHHDTRLTNRDYKNVRNSLTLDFEMLDKLDYLVFRMKEKGIYVTTDFHTNRSFRSGDQIPECDFYDQAQMKMLIPVSSAAMENWKQFVRQWLTHRNPYTGLRWADEPALYCVNMINEEPLTLYWNRHKTSIRLYRERFRKYCAERNLPESAASNDNPVFRKFLHELQDAVLSEQIRFVKEELKMKTLVTSLNCGRERPLTLLRERFDAVDNHAYFDHPEFPEKRWALPFFYQQSSAINRMAEVPRDIMPTRLTDKPFLVTEFNYCNPNIYRAEAGPLIGGYAALQNWSALYRFAWSHSDRDIRQLVSAYGFNANNDPMAQLSDRITIAMFSRGDVQTAKTVYSYQVSRNCFEQNQISGFPVEFKTLGLITAIGSMPEDAAGNSPDIIRLSPEDAVNPSRLKNREIAKRWEQANRNKIAISDTGELRLDARKNTFTVTSPRTESVTLKSGNLSAKNLRIKNAEGFQTVSAISLDGKELARSKSILLLHLTNVASSGLKFGNASRRTVHYRGNLPLLVRKGSAIVEFVTDRPCTVTALDCDGMPYDKISGSFHKDFYRFKIDTHSFPGGVMAYHLTRE